MRRHPGHIGSIAFIILITASLALPPVHAETRTTAAGTYFISTPTNQPAPLIVFLHGQGADETQGARIFERLANDRGYALLAPRGTSPQKSWFLDGGRAVRVIVEEVLAQGGIDKGRILLIGYSAGGTVAYNYGLSNAFLFAGLAVVNCYMQPGGLPLGQRIPVCILDCQGDPNYPAARQAEAYLRDAGFDVTFEEIAGGSHAYPPEASTRALDWFDKKVPEVPSVQAPQVPPSQEAPQVPPSQEAPQVPPSQEAPQAPPSQEAPQAPPSQEAPQAPPPPEPIINGYGIPVGGLTDSEIEQLVQQWFDTVYKPSKSPPNTEHAWRLNEWGIWVSSHIKHIGKIDGYASPVEFFLRTKPGCREFVKSRGLEAHPEPTIADAPPQNDEQTTEAGARPTGPPPGFPTEPVDAPDLIQQPTNGTNAGNPSGTIANASGRSEPVPDLSAPTDQGSLTSGSVANRAYDLFVPDSFSPNAANQWGLVIVLSGIAGNTTYLQAKLQSPCSRHNCIFVGLRAHNASGSRFGFRWENDAKENQSYLREVVTDIEDRFGVSPARTYAIGFSNGAHFLGTTGASLDDVFEGFVMCEGGSFIGSSDKQVVIAGSKPIECSRKGNRWSAYCEGMGHKFPGPAMPMYQDPGITQSQDGLTVDGFALLEWLSN